ncbi:MAG: hypothetical protein EBW84_07265 [Betaproteobacteria bacterium]|nr:hypothetical protein [Betaproteobacteria bacterium]
MWDSAKRKGALQAAEHLQQLANILKDPEASANDRFVALDLLKNASIAAGGVLPMCQDTGMVVAFIEVGIEVTWDSNQSIEEMVNQGVSQAYLSEDNPLRASMVRDPAGKRINTTDNTPAITHVKLVQGNKVSVSIAAKGGGSENKAQFVILNHVQNLTAMQMQGNCLMT